MFKLLQISEVAIHCNTRFKCYFQNRYFGLSGLKKKCKILNDMHSPILYFPSIPPSSAKTIFLRVSNVALSLRTLVVVANCRRWSKRGDYFAKWGFAHFYYIYKRKSAYMRHKISQETSPSLSSTLTIAGALICFITPPFLYTKMSVQISPIGGCNSNWNI